MIFDEGRQKMNKILKRRLLKAVQYTQHEVHLQLRTQKRFTRCA